MSYRLRVANQLGGWLTVMGVTYDVKDHMIEVEDLHTANMLVEHHGCSLSGGDAIKLAKTIVFKRGRGLGDVLLMTPVLRKFKKENPNTIITFACDFIFLDVLKYLPYIDRIITQPQFGSNKDKCWIQESDGSQTFQDYWVNCDGIELLEQTTIATYHRSDIFAQGAGILLLDGERNLDYLVTEEENAWAKDFLAQKGVAYGDKVLGMAVRSTARNRNMDANRFHKIADLANQNGWKIIVFDHDGQFGWEAPGVINMTGKTTIRQMGALISRCTMFFGPDSGAWHLASALNVPNVVYFGAINWKLRVTMPRTKVIFKNVACYPCDRYDCHWHTKFDCVDISPERCWGEIEAFEKTLPKELANVH